MFSDERGLSYADRHERLRESLDLILKCWTATEPFDWDGKHWRGKGIVATPQPLHAPHMPMATATDTESMIDLCGVRGYTQLMAQLEPAGSIRRKADRYARAAKAAGRSTPLSNITVARYVYLADSRRQAMDDLRADINYELGYQTKRGLIRLIKSNYDIGIKGDEVSFDQLAEAGLYYIGEPDAVAKQLREFYEASGGFGTLLIVAGKKWATRDKVFRSMRLFMEQVAPKLAGLEPVRDPDSVAA
jgi:alkanesulfonate monooxygenase SsuD/methylene tetrahydromethanopterin reductase-like flavin-dependent oxidoreductase (luciferase family)